LRVILGILLRSVGVTYFGCDLSTVRKGREHQGLNSRIRNLVDLEVYVGQTACRVVRVGPIVERPRPGWKNDRRGIPEYRGVSVDRSPDSILRGV
jgi:hypothetical protein